MVKAIQPINILFEVEDPFGKKIRTTKRWWLYIITEKHKDVGNKLTLVIKTIEDPDEIRQSDEKPYIYLYYKYWDNFWMCSVARHLNSDGFLMTSYVTTKSKKKGVLIWPKKNEE